MSPWTVYHESSEYWDVGEEVAPPDWAAQEMEPGEHSYRAICRVRKSAGREYLNLVLAAPRLLEAARAALDPDPCQLDHHGNCQAHRLGNPCEQKLLREAIAEAEGNRPGSPES